MRSCKQRVELGLKAILGNGRHRCRDGVLVPVRAGRNKFRPIVYAIYVPNSLLMQMAFVTSMLRFLQAGLTCEELDEIEDPWKVQYSENGR